MVLEFTQGAQGPQGPVGAPGLKGDGYPGVAVSVEIFFSVFSLFPPSLHSSSLLSLLSFIPPSFLSPLPSPLSILHEHYKQQGCSFSSLLWHLRDLEDYQDPLDQWVYVEWGTLEQR